MTRTIIIRESVANAIEEKAAVKPDTFYENVLYFLHQLLDDPINAKIPTCVKMMEISKPRFIRMLEKQGIIEKSTKINDRDKDGNLKTATMSVEYKVLDKVPDELEYKVPKTDFYRKVEKLYYSIFQENVPEKKKETQETEHEIDEATSCAGDGAGAFVGPAFSTVVRRKMEENININSQYRDLGGGFDVAMEDGRNEKSLVTIQNKKTGALYHICFDGSNFDICRDLQDGEPCSHVSYVFDNLLKAFDNNGFVNI